MSRPWSPSFLFKEEQQQQQSPSPIQFDDLDSPIDFDPIIAWLDEEPQMAEDQAAGNGCSGLDPKDTAGIAVSPDQDAALVGMAEFELKAEILRSPVDEKSQNSILIEKPEGRSSEDVSPGSKLAMENVNEEDGRDLFDSSAKVKEDNTDSLFFSTDCSIKVAKANESNEESSELESDRSSDDTSSSSSSSEDEDDDDDDSEDDDDNDEESDSIHKQINVEEEVEEGEIRDAELEEMLVDSDVEDGVPKGPVKSKHEVEILPPVAKVEVSLEPHHQTLPVGVISSILGNTVIVEGSEKHSPLNEGSILWITETRLPLGFIDEIFGPVKNPFYLVRFNSDQELPVGISIGTVVSVVMEFATHIINEKELCRKAYDASGDYDEELNDEVEFSDDEKEAEYRRSLRQSKRGNCTRGQDNKDSVGGKRTHFKGEGSGKHLSSTVQAPKVIDRKLPEFVQPLVASVDFGASQYSISEAEISGVNPPAISQTVQQAAQTGSFGDLPQQLPQQPNAFWANAFQAQQQQNLAIQSHMMNMLMSMQLGDPAFSQQHPNHFGNFPSGMAFQQQLTPNLQHPASTPWLGGLMNPAFASMPLGPIFGSNAGQMTFGASNVQEQVTPGFSQRQNFVQPPQGNTPTGRPPMQFNRGRSSFRGKTPHHRCGRHSRGRGSQM